MWNIFRTLNKTAEVAAPRDPLDRWLPWILCTGAVFILLYQLGGAALFEPDEGRNSEKAREILLLHDWITPHENFHPVLDKPIFFYWLIAFCYKLFGVSEWAARLPSALAALGCVGVICYFARARWGRWEALWAGLILLTSLEFFLLARIVIFDMPLTLALTAALCAFYLAGHSDDARRRRILCVFLYGGLGVATLIKGLVGVVVPGMVICCYLWISNQWGILRRIYLAPGVLLFLAITVPWYLEMGARHDGYLGYFFWYEHFGRFTSAAFGRTAPWYYFIPIGLFGFFPWSLLFPLMISKWRRKDFDDKTLFVILWAAVPFLFFSASTSKLPHYILPIFPPLAVLTAAFMVRFYHASAGKTLLSLALTWIAYGLIVVYLITGALWPRILPYPIRRAFGATDSMPWVYAMGAMVSLVVLFFWLRSRPAPSQTKYYLAQMFAMILLLVFSAQMMVISSSVRSAKGLADIAVPVISPNTQLVFYDTYLSGMPFYLRSTKPLWLVTQSSKKRTFLGNYYALSDREEPPTRWGRSIMDNDEFRQRWRSVKQPMVIFLKQKNQHLLEQQLGTPAEMVGSFDQYVVLHKP